MNSFIIQVLPIKNYEIINDDYSKQIHNSLLDILELENKKDLKVSNIFGMFYEKNIKLLKDEKYKIRVVVRENEVFQKIVKLLFNIVMNKDNLKFGEEEYKLISIITSDKTWCGEYNFEKNFEKINKNENFFEKVNLKIVTPILSNGKYIFGFEKIVNVIFEDLEKEGIKNKGLLEKIKSSISVQKELYRQKYWNNKKIYLGDIELELNGYYGEILNNMLNYVKHIGVGEQKEYGYGEIIVENSENINKKRSKK